MKKSKKIIFVQDCATYKCEFVVCSGYTYEEIIKYAKKHKFKKSFLENMEYAKKEFWDDVYGKNCFVAHNKENNNPFVMILKDVENNWDFYEMLMHECLHIVQSLTKACKMEDEDESQAYLLEYLFREIRRGLKIT